MTPSLQPLFVYINGYPGVGKLTVARELAKLIPGSRILDNHRLIDATAALYERGTPDYQPLRQQMRRLVLRSIASSHATKDTTWIFTDQQSSSEIGTSAAKDYAHAAVERGSTFVSVVLQCNLDENVKRLVGQGRGVTNNNTKLTDVGILHTIRSNEDIYRFGGDAEIEIDITDRSALDVARMVREFLNHLPTPPSAAWPSTQVSAPLPSRERTFDDISGFKHVFIEDLFDASQNAQVDLLCWLKARPRHHGRLVFADLVDSTGSIQAVFQNELIQRDVKVENLTPETSLKIFGIIQITSSGKREIQVSHFEVISPAKRYLHPAIRSTSTEILSSSNSDHLLNFRHIYLRNPLLLALNDFRSLAFWEIRKWFETHRFLDFSAPLITPSLLYDPTSAIHLSNAHKKRPLYLSQCAGFYLEAGAHAHERVYNLGPSFRNESRTNRHLMEYWHIKAEVCSGSMQDIIELVEIFLRDIARATKARGESVCGLLGTTFPEIEIPFQRMRYADAIALLQDHGHGVTFGDNINKEYERWLTRNNGERPLWITHKPKSMEPFPYSGDPTDVTLSMTGDLIAPNGFGEICGVAEKSYAMGEMDSRLQEKDKQDQLDIYGWVRDSRDFGMAPHTAFGMGFERLLRWLCGNAHVKDNIPFPRIFEREPLP